MKINFVNTLIAGIIAGILVGGSRIGTCCCWPVDIIVLLAAGAIAVHLSAATIREQNDAIVTGAVAGLIGGVVGAVLYAVMAVAIQLLFGSITLLGSNDPSQSLPGIGGSTLASGVGSLICCFPTLIVMGVVLGAIGGAIYYTVKK